MNGRDAAAFAGTFTDGGATARFGLELVRLMVIPPEVARPARFTTFAVVASPAVTLDGDNVNEVGTAG